MEQLLLFGKPTYFNKKSFALSMNRPSALLVYLAFRADWVSREELMYLFGNDFSVKNNELEIQFSSDIEDGPITTPEPTSEMDESVIIVGIIVAAAIGAAIFYLKGYKKSP